MREESANTTEPAKQNQPPTGVSRRARQRRIGRLLVAAVTLGIIGLPIALWLDLGALSERTLRIQTEEIGRIVDVMRGYYASDVVARVLSAKQPVTTHHHYRQVDGAIPIPATLSIELGKRISAQDGAVKYRFVSDLPFKGREPHALDAFEREALAKLRANPRDKAVEVSGSIFRRQVRVATPVIMTQICVSCHNGHSDSPKTDWKLGDVRGIQEVSLNQPIEDNIFAFRYLLTYIALATLTGVAIIVLQRRAVA